MRIYCSLVAKNESDVIAGSISKALSWADAIFVIDNGSDDGTSEIVKSLDPRVHLLGSFYGAFLEGLRSLPFNYVNASQTFPRADWWCRMDADEVYLDDPREFLRNVPPYYSRVCTNTVEFLHRLGDATDALKPESYEFYVPLKWSESRFFRNLDGLTWSNVTSGEPRGIGAAYPDRIRVLHFPFRSHAQIARRIQIRRESRAASAIAWSNSQYSTPDELIAQYKRDERLEYHGALEFAPAASNFLPTRTSRLKNAAKVALYGLGRYRSRPAG